MSDAAVIEGEPPVLRLSGDIDAGTAQQVISQGKALVARTGADAVVDVAAVRFMDSAGLAALIAIRQAAVALGRQVTLRNVPDQMARLLTLTGLTAAFAAQTAPTD